MMGAMPKAEYTSSSFTLNPVPDTGKNKKLVENL